jgi:aspartokinase
MGKNAVLDKLKTLIRHLPSEEEQVLRAAEVVFELDETGGIPYLEVLIKVICLTVLPEAKVDSMLPEAIEELGIEFEEMSDEEINTSIVINKEDVMDVYCDLLLKRRFQKLMIEK